MKDSPPSVHSIHRYESLSAGISSLYIAYLSIVLAWYTKHKRDEPEIKESCSWWRLITNTDIMSPAVTCVWHVFSPKPFKGRSTTLGSARDDFGLFHIGNVTRDTNPTPVCLRTAAVPHLPRYCQLRGLHNPSGWPWTSVHLCTH